MTQLWCPKEVLAGGIQIVPSGATRQPTHHYSANLSPSVRATLVSHDTLGPDILRNAGGGRALSGSCLADGNGITCHCGGGKQRTVRCDIQAVALLWSRGGTNSGGRKATGLVLRTTRKPQRPVDGCCLLLGHVEISNFRRLRSVHLAIVKYGNGVLNSFRKPTRVGHTQAHLARNGDVVSPVTLSHMCAQSANYVRTRADTVRALMKSLRPCALSLLSSFFLASK